VKTTIRYNILILTWITAISCGTSTENGASTEKKGSITTKTSETVALSTTQLHSARIVVGTPEQLTFAGELMLQGKIDVPPQSTISLSFPLGGYLRSTNMLPGTRVRKGQVLAELEDMQFIQLQQDYLTAKERFTLAESEYNRQKDLNVSKAISDKVFQQSRAEMETLRILMNALAQKLEVIGISSLKLRADNISKSVSVISPINGFVSKVNVNVGKYTSPTDMLFELIDPRDIHLMLNVFEKDLASLSIGQHVQAFTNNDPERKINAEIILISKHLDENRMAEVHCHFQSYEPSLVPGMFMNGAVQISTSNALSVPQEAIVRWENKFYVFIETGDNTFEMIPVKPGLTSGGRQQLEAEGIAANTRIVVKNAYALLMKIKNTEEEG
jgi:membrane fusion protein, heavy metal efflux system